MGEYVMCEFMIPVGLYVVLVMNITCSANVPYGKRLASS